MAELLKKPVHHPLNDGVQIVQDFKPSDVDLEYTGIKVIDLKAKATYSESTNDFEACVVALTGQIDVSDGTEQYEGLGTRASVFEKIPTDSIYISKAHEIEITAQKDARVVICYSPCEQ